MARCKNVSGPAAGAGGSPGGDGGGDPPRRLSAAEKGKGKKLATKKRKASDREAEVAEAVAAAAKAAERGGRSGALRIGDDLTPQQRRAVLQAEALHGSPPGTVMIGGQRVRITIRDPAQEDPDTETEAQAEGPAEAQQQEQPLRRSTRARTQAVPRTGTQGQSTSAARATPAPRQGPVRIHRDLTLMSAREIQQLRFVPFPNWFPAARDPQAGARFYTVVQEDIYEALVRSQSQFREHRVIDLEILGNVVGADIRQYFTYLHGLPELLALPGTYCEQWVREFYASVWVSLDHSYIHYALAGTDYRVIAQRAREVLSLRAYSIRIHQLCYGNFEPPRRPHGGEIPPVDFVAPCFRPPFGEGSSRTVGDLTRPARILDFVLRKTLLPRTGYRDGFTRIQQWLVAHLISQTLFDLWDLIVSEIEDTISESFRGRR